MKEITVGVILPHELLASFYSFEGGVIFDTSFCGYPGDPWMQCVDAKRMGEALHDYWQQACNQDLKRELIAQSEASIPKTVRVQPWQEPINFEKVIPMRFYGDSADVLGA